MLQHSDPHSVFLFALGGSEMSSKGATKAKQPWGDDSVALMLPTATKRQKTNATDTVIERSLLLNSHPEILRKMYSFLSLKEALVLRRTHRQFNDSRNDIFQYSFILCEEALKERGLGDSDIDRMVYEGRMTHALLTNPDIGNLRAWLRNETMVPSVVSNFMTLLVNLSTADNNAQAVSVLLEDGRCEVKMEQLDTLLRRDFTAMAVALRQNEGIASECELCDTCSNKVGCYACTNTDEVCANQGATYCRQCAMNDSHFCKECEDYLCSKCFEEEQFDSCEKCHGIICKHPECVHGCEQCGRKKCDSCIVEDGKSWTCFNCPRKKCDACIGEDGDDWVYVEVEGHCCPACADEFLVGGDLIESSSEEED